MSYLLFNSDLQLMSDKFLNTNELQTLTGLHERHLNTRFYESEYYAWSKTSGTWFYKKPRLDAKSNEAITGIWKRRHPDLIPPLLKTTVLLYAQYS